MATTDDLSPASALAIAVSGLGRRFGEFWALKGLTMTVESGSVCALVGANGAGKSTLLRLLAGLARPSRGEISLFGERPVDSSPALQKRIGFVGHRSLLYRNLSLRENLDFFARLYGAQPGAAETALRSVGLLERSDELPQALSRGMLQRASLARALMHEPELLLLDEPFSALDATWQLKANDLVLSGGKRTVLVATHDLNWVRSHATQTVELVGGKLVAGGAKR